MMHHIGLDLDNTIINYDRAFPQAGQEIGVLPTDHGLTTKSQVRAYLLARENGMEQWMRLQGQVYGPLIAMAEPYDGVFSFMRVAQSAGVRLSIVSQKTRYGHYDESKISLWNTARGWLDRHEIFRPAGLGLDPANLYFEETRENKIRRISMIGCDAFVDDLPEVLNHPLFPNNVVRLWFAGRQLAVEGGGLMPLRQWSDITSIMLQCVTSATHYNRC